MPQTNDADFARDLGYLDKFFDKLDAAAKELGDARGSRLSTLVEEERARWAEIKSILAGAAAATAPSSSSQPAAATADVHAAPVGSTKGAPTSAGRPAPPSPPPPSSSSRTAGAWTVGSLVKRG